nr:immunoglobulin heavy chain junction region [Macaca mulatta]
CASELGVAEYSSGWHFW